MYVLIQMFSSGSSSPQHQDTVQEVRKGNEEEKPSWQSQSCLSAGEKGAVLHVHLQGAHLNLRSQGGKKHRSSEDIKTSRGTRADFTMERNFRLCNKGEAQNKDLNEEFHK